MHASAHCLEGFVRTGLPFWLRVAASATSDASVSTSEEKVSSIAVTTASSIVFLRLSKASTAGGGGGNDLQEAIGLIRSDPRTLGSIGNNRRIIRDTCSWTSSRVERGVHTEVVNDQDPAVWYPPQWCIRRRGDAGLRKYTFQCYNRGSCV